jgi:hypothetical protein
MAPSSATYEPFATTEPPSCLYPYVNNIKINLVNPGEMEYMRRPYYILLVSYCNFILEIDKEEI